MSSNPDPLLDEVVKVTIEPEDSFIFSDAPLLGRLGGSDWGVMLLLAVFTLFLNSIGLDSLEFFRHTEADRTLIAWDMFEHGDYLVPQLIHSPILTKPPLYYWTLAAAMHLFGGVSEAIARFPSVFFSVLFVMLSFFVARRAGGSRQFALVSALVLETSFIFFHQSTVAEIDLLFGLLSFCTFTAGFFGLVRNNSRLLLSSYFFCGVAFLAKGPPVVFFFIAGQGALFLYLLFTRRKAEKKFMHGRDFLMWNLVGVFIFLAIVSSWLVFVASQVGWSEIVRQFDIEVLQRIVVETHIRRGPLFYIGAIFSGLVPWSPFLLVGLLLGLRGYRVKRIAPEFRSESAELFIAFNLIYLLTACVMLSASAGKSVRYIFPVHFSAVYLTAISIIMISRHPVRRWFFLVGLIAGAGTALALPVTGLLMHLQSVPLMTQMGTALLMSLPLWMLVYCCWHAQAKGAFFAIVLTMVGLRVGEWKVFSPYRSSVRTVKPIAQQIDKVLPPGAIVYNVELFDRWITYYLKERGRDTYRLSPEEAMHPRTTNGKAFLLLNFSEEAWRLEQLQEFDPSARVLEEYSYPKTHVLLVESQPEALAHLEPHEIFPTKPSPAFYNNPEKAKNYKPVEESDD